MPLIGELFSDKQTQQEREWEKERKPLVSIVFHARKTQLNTIGNLQYL